jgi:hypothetical protein
MTSMQLPRNLENVAFVTATSQKQHAVFMPFLKEGEMQLL